MNPDTHSKHVKQLRIEADECKIIEKIGCRTTPRLFDVEMKETGVSVPVTGL